ncbi:MAG: hypothetical protein WC223_10325 [Bacteroidales bacterium]|jgi:hypothetical protein
MKRKHLILSAIFIAIIIIFSIGLYIYFKPQKNFATSKSDYILTSRQLFNEFEKNETESNKKYVTDDKTIQISGFVVEIGRDTDSTLNLIIGESPNANGLVSCSFMKTENKNLENIKSNDKIFIKGQCTGFQGLIDKTVIMIRCAVVRE